MDFDFLRLRAGLCWGCSGSSGSGSGSGSCSGSGSSSGACSACASSFLRLLASSEDRRGFFAQWTMDFRFLPFFPDLPPCGFDEDFARLDCVTRAEVPFWLLLIGVCLGCVTSDPSWRTAGILELGSWSCGVWAFDRLGDFVDAGNSAAFWDSTDWGCSEASVLCIPCGPTPFVSSGEFSGIVCIEPSLGPGPK